MGAGRAQLLALAALALCCCASSAAAAGCDAGALRAYLRDIAAMPAPAPYKKGATEKLVFLHIPRSGGRVVHKCLLQFAHEPAERCPEQYAKGGDAEAGDAGAANATDNACVYVSSRQDLSLLHDLPATTAVFTQLRDPVDRVVSAYEYAIEVAAQKIANPEVRARAHVGRLH